MLVQLHDNQLSQYSKLFLIIYLPTCAYKRVKAPDGEESERIVWILKIFSTSHVVILQKKSLHTLNPHIYHW